MRLYDVIQNESYLLNDGMGSKSTLAWKFLGENFKDNSQLIVSEAEEAVFIRDGVAVAVFDGGRYTLNTSNHPFFGALRNVLTGGAVAFTSKVYFVNKDHKLELLWGTDSPIQLRDPVLRLQTSVLARGSFSVQVADSKKFLLKLIGNNIQLFTQEEMAGYFRSAFLQHIKDAIARHIKDSNAEILEICTERTAIADGLKPTLTPILDSYGLELVDFYVAAIDIPESDPNRGKLEEAFADKGVMGILGDDWARQQSATILRDVANNPGAGGVAAAGAGAGMGFAAGSAFSNMAAQMFVGDMSGTTPGGPGSAGPAEPGRDRRSRFEERPAATGSMSCPSCSSTLPEGARFCSDCGTAVGPVPCRACGEKQSPTAKFCSSCGTSTGVEG